MIKTILCNWRQVATVHGHDHISWWCGKNGNFFIDYYVTDICKHGTQIVDSWTSSHFFSEVINSHFRLTSKFLLCCMNLLSRNKGKRKLFLSRTKAIGFGVVLFNKAI